MQLKNVKETLGMFNVEFLANIEIYLSVLYMGLVQVCDTEKVTADLKSGH